MRGLSLCVLAAAAIVAAYACGDSTSPPTITGITFGRDTATLLLDDSLSTSAAVTNSDGNPAPNAVVTYTTSAPEVATVDATGRIRTFATGSATITATVENLHADVNITVVRHFTQFATGNMHVCGIAGTGRVYCWGSDIDGNLGAGTNTPDCTQQIGGHCSLMPIPVSGAERFVTITAGAAHTCGLTSTGAAYCWGGNYAGQLGIGTASGTATVPTRVSGGVFTSIRAGRMHTCGIATSGDTYCWGWDGSGQLGAGATAAQRCNVFGPNQPCSGTPLKVVGNVGFVELNGSERQTCGRDAVGAIYCWGFDIGGTEVTDCEGGQFSKCTRTPLLQVGGATFPVFGMGYVYRCGQKSDGVTWCWGFDSYGFGNDGPYAASDTLIRAAGGKSYAQAVFGRQHVCGLNSGSVECWGNGYDGQVGGAIGVDRSTPGPVSGGVTFESITTGPNADVNCGISTAGRAYCWGDGRLGQLGNGTLASSAQPVLVKLVR